MEDVTGTNLLSLRRSPDHEDCDASEDKDEDGPDGEDGEQVVDSVPGALVAVLEHLLAEGEHDARDDMDGGHLHGRAAGVGVEELELGEDRLERREDGRGKREGEEGHNLLPLYVDGYVVLEELRHDDDGEEVGDEGSDADVEGLLPRPRYHAKVQLYPFHENEVVDADVGACSHNQVALVRKQALP